MSVIGAIGLIASMAASAYGMHKSAKANKAAENQVKKNQQELDAYRDTEMYTDFVNSKEGMAYLRPIYEQIRANNKSAKNSAAIKGTSSERQIAQRGENQRMLADTVNNLSREGGRRRYQAQNQYWRNKSGLDAMRYNIQLGRAANWDNFTSNAANFAGSVADADAAGAFDEWESKLYGRTKWGKRRITDKLISDYWDSSASRKLKAKPNNLSNNTASISSDYIPQVSRHSYAYS